MMIDVFAAIAILLLAYIFADVLITLFCLAVAMVAVVIALPLFIIRAMLGLTR